MLDSSNNLLLTTGPVTVAPAVRRALDCVWDPWSTELAEATADVRESLLDMAGGIDTHLCVPLSGSMTLAVEAAMASLPGPGDGVLVLVNGPFGHRLAHAARAFGRPVVVQNGPESAPVEGEQVRALLRAHRELTHVALVQCEASGLVNPVDDIALVVASEGRSLILDAGLGLGVLDLDLAVQPIDAVIGCAEAGLEGVAGVSFVLVSRAALARAAGHGAGLVLDLHDQWVYMAHTGRWRDGTMAPAVAAFAAALRLFREEGGVTARRIRLGARHRRLRAGLEALGLTPLVPPGDQAPVAVALRPPGDPAFAFADFWRRLRQRGVFVPGQTAPDSGTFQVGCLGRLSDGDVDRGVATIDAVLDDMGIQHRPAGRAVSVA